MAGRPTLYTPELADSILEKLAEGLSLVQICAADEMPGLRTVMRWAKENDDFGTEYAHAREAQAEIMDDKILTAADGADKNPQSARVKIDAYKWRAAKLAPKRFGDKLDLTSAGDRLGDDLDGVARATRLASIMADIEKRRNAN